MERTSITLGAQGPDQRVEVIVSRKPERSRGRLDWLTHLVIPAHIP